MTLEEEIKLNNQKWHKKINNIMNYFLWSSFLFGIGISYFYSTYFIGISVGGLCICAFYLTKILLPKSNLYQYVLSAILAVLTFQFIYQMHGLAEMHFFAFMGFIALVAYQNWRIMIPNAVLLAIHHLGLFILERMNEENLYLSDQGFWTYTNLFFHVLLAYVILGLCIFYAYILEKRTTTETINNRRIEEQLSTVKKNLAFAEELTKGNFESQYESQAEDVLGQSLLLMRNNLKIASIRDENDKFMNIGIAKAAELLRHSNNNVESLAESILYFLIKYLNANQGGLFVVNDEDKNNVQLDLKACYAYDRKKFEHKTIAIDDGLVGQCYLEKETILLTDVPNNYVKITSGLGLANPTCLVIVPLKSNEEVLGVIEIASFVVLDKIKVDFIEKIGESIASSIATVRVNERTNKLLEESQTQSQLLHSQEEEMRQNLEELMATQEEMNRKTCDLEKIALKEKKNAEAKEVEHQHFINQLKTEFKQKEELLHARIQELEKIMQV